MSAPSDCSNGPLSPHAHHHHRHVRSIKSQIRCVLGNWVSSQTAAFCEDYETVKGLHQPPARVTVRVLLSAVVLLMSFILVTVLFITRDAGFKTVRYWGSSYAQDRFSASIRGPNATLTPDYKTIAASMICPCSNTAISWISYLDLYTISYFAPQEVARTATIVNGSDFCTRAMSHLAHNESYITRIGCPNLVDSVANKDDERTILEASSLMDPVLLNSTVRRHMQSNLVKALNDCVFLMSNSSDWKESVHFNNLRNTYEAFSDMLQVYASNSHASDYQFWSMANDTITTSNTPLIQVLDNKQALGMQVNWSRYLQACNPIYCDVVKEVSFTSKLFSDLAQIGGFAALMLFAIRKVLWPSLCFLCRW